jgi:hypothetical protein
MRRIEGTNNQEEMMRREHKEKERMTGARLYRLLKERMRRHVERTKNTTPAPIIFSEYSGE